jgi:hypothetical protein
MEMNIPLLLAGELDERALRERGSGLRCMAVHPEPSLVWLFAQWHHTFTKIRL